MNTKTGSSDALLVGCLAAPAGICATLERATVATMVLQTIRNIRSRRRKSRCLHTKERGGSIVRPSPQRQPGPTEHGDLVRPVAGSWLRGWRAGQPQRLRRCRSAPRAARRPRGCCASLELAERYVERSHRRRLEQTAFEFKSGARSGCPLHSNWHCTTVTAASTVDECCR